MWVDGYWQGKMIDGYPATYFDDGHFQFPWEKNVQKSTEVKRSDKKENSLNSLNNVDINKQI